MKKLALIAAVCALALTLPACDKTKRDRGGREGDRPETENVDEEEVEAIYEDETYDIDEMEVIDPNDEEAYARYGGKYEEDEPDVPTGPSDVDMVNIRLTEPAHVDMLLDQFDYDIKQMSELVKDKQRNAAAIEPLANHIIKITEKMNEAAEDGICSETQLGRYQQLSSKFLDVVNSSK